MYVLSYVTSVRFSSWINKGDYYYYFLTLGKNSREWLKNYE